MKAILTATMLALVAASAATPSTAQNVANSTSTATSGSFSGSSNTNNFNSKSATNTPSVGIGGGSASPRTCAANMGLGASVAGFGFGINMPTEMKGCAVERAFGMVKGIPGLRTTVRRDALVQVACQDKYAGAALTAAGKTCLVGRYKNRRAANVASVNYVRSRAGTKQQPETRKQRSPAPAGGYWYSGQCTAKQQTIYIGGVERPCR